MRCKGHGVNYIKDMETEGATVYKGHEYSGSYIKDMDILRAT